MATFSQGFLSSLGRPQMAESLFGLGRAIGGLPGQAQDRRKREQFNQLMQHHWWTSRPSTRSQKARAV
jgi:hypothetical protein